MIQENQECDPTGRYVKTSSELGRGAYKVVYRAIDRDLGREVAWNEIKIVEDADIDKLWKEISILKNINHPNVLACYNSWVDEKNYRVVFITECMTSGTLRNFLQKAKKVKLKVIKNWCKQILEGLNYLHTLEVPIIHRDIKCDNIFIDGNSGKIKIGDLGLATSNIQHYSRNKMSIIGTPEFMAPECYEEEYDEKVDIWAFGMCVLEMATLEYPFMECENPAQIFKKVIHGHKPKSLEKIMDNEVYEFIVECLKPVEERKSASELLKMPFLQNIDDEANNRTIRLRDEEEGLEIDGAIQNLDIKEILHHDKEIEDVNLIGKVENMNQRESDLGEPVNFFDQYIVEQFTVSDKSIIEDNGIVEKPSSSSKKVLSSTSSKGKDSLSITSSKDLDSSFDDDDLSDDDYHEDISDINERDLLTDDTYHLPLDYNSDSDVENEAPSILLNSQAMPASPVKELSFQDLASSNRRYADEIPYKKSRSMSVAPLLYKSRSLNAKFGREIVPKDEIKVSHSPDVQDSYSSKIKSISIDTTDDQKDIDITVHQDVKNDVSSSDKVLTLGLSLSVGSEVSYVEFEYVQGKDTPLEVATEMVRELDLSESNIIDISRYIEAKIEEYFENVNRINGNNNNAQKAAHLKRSYSEGQPLFVTRRNEPRNCDPFSYQMFMPQNATVLFEDSPTSFSEEKSTNALLKFKSIAESNNASCDAALKAFERELYSL